MKILFLNPAAGLGGAERALREIVAALRIIHRRVSISIILGEDGPIAGLLREFGAEVAVIPFPQALALAGDAAAGGPAGSQINRMGLLVRLGTGSPAIAAYLRRLANAISRVGPDVIHTNGFKAHILGAWAAPRRTPVVWHLHDFVSPRPLMSRLMKRNAPRCAAVVANSNSVAADAHRLLRLRAPITTVYNSVDLESFTPSGHRLDLDTLAGMTPAAPGTVRVGMVATMARWKGHEVFLRALAMLRNSNVRGYVIGGSVYRTMGSQYILAELHAMAVRLGLGGRVGFTGFIADSASAMRALDIVVHASVAPEPFGLVIAEAFACGRALIASRAGGAAEIIHEDEDALAHRPGDAEELAQAIARLAVDARLRERLGAAARRTAERDFTRARLATQLMAVYEALAPQCVALAQNA